MEKANFKLSYVKKEQAVNENKYPITKPKNLPCLQQHKVIYSFGYALESKFHF